MSKFDEVFRVREPEDKVKMLIFGDSGVGKTTLAIECFPAPIFVDCEEGTGQYQKYYNFPAAYPKNWKEFLEVLGLIKNAQEGQQYKTLVIDPISIAWLWFKKDWEQYFVQSRAGHKSNKGRYYEMGGLDWDKLKSDWREKLLKILALDMNIVCIARAKNIVEGKELTKVGETSDCEKTINYDFDTVIQLCYDEKHRERYFWVVKDRCKANPLPEKTKIKLEYEIFRKRVKKEKIEITEIMEEKEEKEEK